MKKKIALIATLIIIASIIFICRPVKKVVPRKACGVAATMINEFSLDPTQKLVFYFPWKWDQKKLRVYFEDIEDQAIKRKVLETANLWYPHTGIKFILASSSGSSEIRVAFRAKKGYYSLIGSLADSAKYGEYNISTTMWLEDVDSVSSDEFKRVVLHEFGHAIGLFHELQSKKSTIVWDSIAVYRYFDSLYHWRHEEVNQNIFAPVEIGDATLFDPKSIMIYAIPENLMKNHHGIPWPSGLSQIDKEKIKILYP